MQLKLNNCYNYHENPEITVNIGDNNKKIIIGRLYKQNDFIPTNQVQNSKSKQFSNLNGRVIQNKEHYISIKGGLTTNNQKTLNISKSTSTSNKMTQYSQDLSLQYQSSLQTQNRIFDFKYFEKKYQMKYCTVYKKQANQNVKLERSLFKQLYMLFPRNSNEKEIIFQKLKQCRTSLSNSKISKTISKQKQLVETASFIDPLLNQNFDQIRSNFQSKTFLENSKYNKQHNQNKCQTETYQTVCNRLCPYLSIQKSEKVFNNNSRYLRESSKMRTKTSSQKYINRYCLDKETQEKKNSVSCQEQCSRVNCECRVRKSTSNLYSFLTKDEVNNGKIINKQSSSQRIELIRKQLHQIYNKRNQISTEPNFLKTYIKREQKNDVSKMSQRNKVDNESFYNLNRKYPQFKKPMNYSHRLLLNRSNQALI